MDFELRRQQVDAYAVSKGFAYKNVFLDSIRGGRSRNVKALRRPQRPQTRAGILGTHGGGIMQGEANEWENRIRREVARLATCAGDYSALHEALLAKRLAWWGEHGMTLGLTGPLPRRAYTLFVMVYLRLDPAVAPVVYEDELRIVWRSVNICPTAEACLRLGLDTKVVCREGTERSVEALIRRLDDRLRFGRNYEGGLRPYAPYCEEMIWLAE